MFKLNCPLETKKTSFSHEKKRISFAREILSQVPEAAKILKTPTMDAGRKFSEAIKGKDFTALVGPRLPTSFK